MPRKCTAPIIDPKIKQRLDIQIGDIEKGDKVDYVQPKNAFWRGIETVHSVKKNNIVAINVVGEHTHITFRHIRAIHKHNGTEWVKFK